MPASSFAPGRARGPVRGLALAALCATAVTLAGCGDGADPEPSGRAPLLVQPSQPSVADDITQEGVPQLVSVTLADGAVTGAIGSVPVALNTRVRLTALTDTSEVLLVQGYGVRAQLTVGEPVQLTFIADRRGTFPVVLEASGKVLTTLQVN